MSTQKFVLYVVTSLFLDWLLQQPEWQDVEAKYAPRIPAIAAIALVIFGVDAVFSGE